MRYLISIAIFFLISSPLLAYSQAEGNPAVTYSSDPFCYHGGQPYVVQYLYCYSSGVIEFEAIGSEVILYFILVPQVSNITLCINSSCQIIDLFFNTLYGYPLSFPLSSGNNNITITVNSGIVYLDSYHVENGAVIPVPGGGGWMPVTGDITLYVIGVAFVTGAFITSQWYVVAVCYAVMCCFMPMWTGDIHASDWAFFTFLWTLVGYFSALANWGNQS